VYNVSCDGLHNINVSKTLHIQAAKNVLIVLLLFATRIVVSCSLNRFIIHCVKLHLMIKK
jgi:hypothetical protein